MARQIKVFALSDDLDALEARYKELAEFVILQARHTTSSLAHLQHLRVVRMGQEPLCVYLARQCDVEAICLTEVPKRSEWHIDDLRSPVIEFGRTYFDGKTLRGGRLYYQTGYYDDESVWNEWPRNFLEWADSVFRVTRRLLNRDATAEAFFGPTARSIADAPGVTVV